jgi:hypothetical protein
LLKADFCFFAFASSFLSCLWLVLQRLAAHFSEQSVTALTCYLDDSGSNKQSPVMVIAGYMATLTSWKDAERGIRPIFDRHGVKVLHGKKFHDRDAEFSGWSPTQKLEFVGEVYGEFRQHSPLGLSHAILKSIYQQRKTESGLNRNTSAFGHAFVMTFNSLVKHPGVKEHLVAHRSGLSFILETGNANNQDVLRAFGNLKKKYKLDWLASLSFADKQSSIAIQLSDFLAFHTRRYIDEREVVGPSHPHSDILKLMMDGIPNIGRMATDFS